jgi:hypothetical protein
VRGRLGFVSKGESVATASAERGKVENFIQNYFQGYLTADRALVAKAFHPETLLFSIGDGKLEKAEMAGWLCNLEERKSKGDVRSAD